MTDTAPAHAMPPQAGSTRADPREWSELFWRTIRSPYFLALQILVHLSQNAATARAPFNPGVLLYAIPGAIASYLSTCIQNQLPDIQNQWALSFAVLAASIALLLG